VTKQCYYRQYSLLLFRIATIPMSFKHRTEQFLVANLCTKLLWNSQTQMFTQTQYLISD